MPIQGPAAATKKPCVCIGSCSRECGCPELQSANGSSIRIFKSANRPPALLVDQRNELPFGTKRREQENA
jgi:hypothetical protein